ncbi:hypothetical protein BV20DRAFT_994726 [Pilatotrama ljubarskyi]|nr:hypothetical protein BV20DRAFT_994726 [Pilatotrama ljubarskyi]
MSLSVFWDPAGECTELEPMPETWETWLAQSNEPLEDERRILLHQVEEALSLKIIRMETLAADGNLVVAVEYENGHQDVVRSPRPNRREGEQHSISVQRFWREINLLKWLKEVSSLQVPSIRAIIEPQNPERCPYVVMDKMPGSVLMNVAGRMPYEAKERLMYSHAEVFLQLFRLKVPQRIGTLCVHEPGGLLDIVPWQAIGSERSAARVYDTLEQFVDGLIESRRQSGDIGTDEAARLRGEEVLARLAEKLSPICKRLSRPSLRRCVLVHDDLNQTNILSNESGEITGVIDWEYQSVRPAVLAAKYPGCIRYDGINDPQYASGDEWWTVSPGDARKLRELYAQIVKDRDYEYWEALVEGETLRQAVEWLSSPGSDEGCVLLEQWMDTVYPRD